MINIRIIREEDAQHMHLLVQRNAKRLKDYFPVTIEKTLTREKALQTIKMYKMLEEQKQLVVFMVEQKSELVAVVFLKNFDKKVNKCEVSYFTDKESEGQGIATQAVKEIAAKAFNDYNISKLFCRIDTNNTASNKVARKVGFQLEGILKQEFQIADGSVVDINYYGMLKSSV